MGRFFYIIGWDIENRWVASVDVVRAVLALARVLDTFRIEILRLTTRVVVGFRTWVLPIVNGAILTLIRIELLQPNSSAKR